MRKLLLLTLFLISQQSFAATKWCSAAGAGTADGSTAGNACVFSTANVLTAFGGAIARGDILYICGDIGNTQWAPGGIGAGDGTSLFTINGNATDSGCTAGTWTVSSVTPISIGGASRSNVKVTDIAFTNSGTATLGINIGATGAHTISNFLIQNNTFTGFTAAGVQLTAAADGTTSAVEIKNNTFSTIGSATPLGASVSAVPSIQGAGSASGLITGVLVHDNTFNGSATVGRSGVSFYPPYTAAGVSGRVRASKVYNNTFKGPYLHSAINLQTDTDDTEVYGNSFSGTFGGAVIHVGGASIASEKEGGCVFATTDNTIVRDHGNTINGVASGTAVSGAVFNSENTVDAAGIYLEECSVGTKVFRNFMKNNQLADMYGNDTDTALVVGNIFGGQGHSAIHFHGVGANNVFYNNTINHTNFTVQTVGDLTSRGPDAVQIDPDYTGTVFYSNIIKGSNQASQKCLDVDATFTESNNSISGCDTLIEGATQTSAVNSDPKFDNTSNTNITYNAFRPNNILLKETGKTQTTQYYDFFGRPFRSTPSIGAFEFTSGFVAGTRNPRN